MIKPLKYYENTCKNRLGKLSLRWNGVHLSGWFVRQVTAEFVQSSVEIVQESRIDQVEEILSEGSVEENIEALRALSPYGEEVSN